MLIPKTIFTTRPRRPRRALPGCVFVLLLAACRSGPREVSPEKPAPVPRAMRPGAMEGEVRLAGHRIPVPDRVENTTDPAFCGRMQTLENLVVSPRNRGIQGVIVALTDVPPEKIPAHPPERLVLDNIQCRFSPHVSVLTVGSTIETSNSDSVLHTTHLYGAVERNMALPLRGTRVATKADKPGMIIVKCDVHGWMQAFIRVDDDPFHAATDAAGRFRIPNLPPGEYTLECWHERLGALRRTIRIQEGQTERIELEYALDMK